MQKQKLILVGGGGHCKACIDVIESVGCYEIIGILDQTHLVGETVLSYPILGTDLKIPDYVKKGYQFLITVGQIKSPTPRLNLSKVLDEYGADMATVLSPKSYVSPHAVIGRGTIIMHHVAVNASARIGENCILNNGCIVEHDAIIGSHTHISTHAVINGDCIIGNKVFIGSNATISNNMSIADEVIIGAGSVIIKSILNKQVQVGNPAKRI